ncbi:hypothetical protein GCM10010458_36620 [Microbacterium luteolum]|uniref:Uncharacterized protein n=1 Tax=Microbacterium luteolum TaxID=69367 RepID=A0ABY7XKL3_MICLT|nr:hypothetical protein [Microbacterium luteolum]WDM42527.1 hypothetical protein KV395_04240 [Microbacterium luteolum]
MTTRGIRYFNRPYTFADDEQADLAATFLRQIASGQTAGRLLQVGNQQIFVTPGTDVILYEE